MKTMINIKADKEVKAKAQQVAKELGMPLSTVINAYLKQFVRTKEVHFSVEGILKPSTRKRLARLHKDVLEHKNLSKEFPNVEDAINYLNS